MTDIPFYETERNYLEFAKIIDTKDLAAESAEALVKAEIKGKEWTFFAPNWAGEDRYLFKPGNKFTVKIVINETSYQIIQGDERTVEDSPNANSKSIVQGEVIDILTVHKSWEKNGNIELKYAILDCGFYIWFGLTSTFEFSIGDYFKIVGRLDIIRK